MIIEATKTIIALVCNSFQVGQDTLLTSSSIVSSMYVIIFATLIFFLVQSSSEPFCTGGKIRTLDLWCWRPLLYQLSYARKNDKKGGNLQAPPYSRQILINYCYSIISVTCPAPTVLPPSRIANLSPLSIATGVINSTVIVTLSPGITISLPDSNSIVPVTSNVLK